jgi:DedD protein
MMEKALKERIIGAIVLVAVAVLVVPVFLDGPPSDDELVSERVPLPGQSEQKTQTVVLDRDRDEPVPAQVEPAQVEPAQVEPTQVEPASATETATQASPPPEPLIEERQTEPEAVLIEAAKEPEPLPAVQTASSSTGMWAVQLGSFSNQENADKLAADLRKQGFAAFLSQLQTGAGQLHRVRVGPQKDREAAEAMATRLQKAGHSGKVLPHP